MDTPIDRRAQLMNAIVEALLAHGAAELSLRPLAERVGTSARLLIYHFGSKEQLLADTLAEVRHRILAALAADAVKVHPKTLRELVMMVWDWAVAPANQNYFRLLFEVDGLTMFDQMGSTQEAGRAHTATWISAIERAAERLPADGPLFAAHSTLILGALAGLLQEFLSTGDLDRTTAAMSALIDLIVQTPKGSKS
jgi:AcrR family transcriptional regulator